MSLTLAEYRAQQKARGGKVPRGRPEHALQVHCAAWFHIWLKPEVKWIAGAAGLRLSPKVREDAFASGALRRGWTDLTFFCSERGRSFFMELKVGSNGLEPEQQDFRDAAEPHGVWALCRTIEAVIQQVTAWGLVREGAPCR